LDWKVITEPFATLSQGWGVNVVFEGGLGNDRLRYGYIDPLPELDRPADGSLRGVSENVVLTGSATRGSGQLQVTQGDASFTILQLDFSSLEDVALDLNDASMGDDDRLTIAGTSQADEITADFSRAGTFADPWIIYGPSAAPRFTISQFVRWSATSSPVASLLPQLAFAMQAGDDGLQITSRTNANHPLAPTLLAIDGGSSLGGDQIVVTGTSSANDTFRYVPGPLGAGQLEVTRALSPTTTLQFSNTERVAIDGGGGLGSDRLTLIGTAQPDLITLGATTVSGGTLQLGNTTQLAFDRFGYGSITNATEPTSRIVVQSLGGSDTIQLQHRANWQIAEVSIEAGDQTPDLAAGDTVSLTTSDEADDILFDALSMNSGTFVVRAGGTTTRFSLLNVESVLLDAADPSTSPGDVLSSNVLLTPGTDPGSGSSTVATLLPLQYRHVEVATPITGSVLEVEGTDGDDIVTITIEDYDQDRLVDDPVLRINGVPFDLRGYSDVILDTKGGNDRVTLIPTVGDQTIVLRDGLTIRGGTQGTIGDTFELQGVGSGLTALSVQQMERISILGRDDVDRLTSTRDRIRFEQGGIHTEFSIDPLSLQKLTAILLGGDDLADFSQLTRPVELWGGNGNDLLRGGSGADQLYGEQGNDQLQAGPGNDQQYGGEGSDLFIWNAGDGADLIEGHAGIDQLLMVGNPGSDRFELSAQGARLAVTRSAPGDTTATLSLAEVEELELNTLLTGVQTAAQLGGEDQFIIQDLSTTDLRALRIGLGAHDDEVDTISIHGRSSADNLLLMADDLGLQVAGLQHTLRILAAVRDEDRLQVFGHGGDDRIVIQDLSDYFAPAHVKTYGGDGQDTLSGFGYFYGDAGDDQLTGDAYDQLLDGGSGADRLDGAGGSDRLFGQSGDDLLVASTGNDRFDGGTGFDTILQLGTIGADSIVAYQASATQLQLTLNDVVQSHTLVAGSLEQLQLQAGSGTDQLRVRWHDLLSSEVGFVLPVLVIGEAEPSSADRLTVVDDGSADAAILRTSRTVGEGLLTLGPANPQPFTLTYRQLQQLTLVDNNGVPIDPNATSGSRLAVFAPDDFEPNNNAELATSLGLLSETIERQGTIDPAGDTTTGQAADVDWFRFQAPFTGLADITLRFQEVGPREGRPGLPGNGNLDLMLYNASGMVLAGNGPAFGTNDGPAELNTDGDPDAEDERIRMPIVKDSIYLVRVAGRTAQAINSYRIHFSASAAPTPQQLQLRTTPETIPTSDTGRSNRDQITQQVRPTLLVQVDDYLLRNDRPDQDSIGPPLDERIPIPFPNTHAPGYRVAIFQHGLTSAGSGEGSSGGVDSGSANVPVGFASRTDSEGWYAFTLPTNLTDGTHQFSARVQMIEPLIPSGGMTSPGTINPVSGFGPASERLTMVVDTVIPELSLGSPFVSTDGLQPESGDTGISGDPQTFSDRVTSDSTPLLWGYTEPQALVRVYVDRNRDGSVDANDLLIGSTTAASNHVDPIIPPLGTLVAWNLIPNIALDDPLYFPASGVRPLLVVAEDVAGNSSSPQRLNIFLDKSGPVITGININQPSDPYSLFDPRAATDSFTPPVRALVIHVLDRDPRDASDPGFLYAALHPATTLSPARYSLVGLQNGVIPIQTIEWNPSPGKAGEPASGTITLRFANPLPDDRYTLTLDDQLRDPAGNQLDGESNAAQPLMAPAFPSGDGTPGGSFLARFNIDSRVELAAARNGQVAIDANGNFLFDPGHADASYRDVVFSLPQATDQVFAGNWAPPSATAASGFDKLGVYGLVDAVYRFALDTDDNGSLDFTSVNAAPFQIAGKPIAGDFATQHPGDEIGLFDPQALRWILDTDGNQRLQSGDRVLLLDRASYPEFAERRDLDKTLFPLVGDFNGDGVTDLTLFDPTQDRFHIDLNRDGRRDAVVDFGIPGQTERPITGDFNLDGVDDLGVVTYDPTGNSTTEPAAAFWSILVSDVGTQTLPASPSRLFAAYSPAPVGNDLFASFGSVRHQPLAGNFATVSSGDPPGSDSGGEPSGSPYTHPLRPLDVNNDGWVTAQDALRLINAINRFGSGPLPLIVADSPQDLPPNAYLDVTQDGSLTPLDVLTVVNALNRRAAAEGSASGSPNYGEGEAEGEGDVQSDHLLLSNRMVLQARDQAPLIRIQNSERGPSDIATPTAIFTVSWRSFAPSLAQDVAHDRIPSTHGHDDHVHEVSLRPLVSRFAELPNEQQSHALSASTPSTRIAFQPERRYLSSRTFDPLEALSSGDLNHRLPGHSRKHSFSRPDPTQLGSNSEPATRVVAKHAQRDHSESGPTLDPMIVDLLLSSPKDLT
jgi:Ca2+-binding RTX toxin-like protein